MGTHITTSEAAGIIGCVDSRVRQLLRKGSLRGLRMGRDWLVERASAEEYRDGERKPGPKPKGAEAKPAGRRK